jgi:hypothetical protein
VNTVPDLNKATAIAATGQTKAAAAPRVKLLSHGFSIDHPDSELGGSRCDAWHPPTIGEGQREGRET